MTPTTRPNKVALITGVTGQGGANLVEFLLKKGYGVHGIKRRASSFNITRIDHLAAQSHVAAELRLPSADGRPAASRLRRRVSVDPCA